MPIDHKHITEKWQKRWNDAHFFEPEVDVKKKPFYIQVAYPYPSGAMHIGHARTYSITDIVARYERMQGCNVLMPMGWHVSGTPVIASVELLKNKDPKTIDKMVKIFRIPESHLKQLETPEGFVDYFVDKAATGYKAGFKKLGFGIDWRRELTTMDKTYNKFIEWQYHKLYEKGYIAKGNYPVRFCPHDKNPVGDHDLVEGEGLGITEFVLLKFKYKDMFVIAATLRPETVYGQTNMWINPDVEYVIANVGNEKWIVSKECAEKLKYQNHKIDISGKIKGSELVGKYLHAPGVEKDIITLPASFCDPNIGTGIVTSVPGHAPFDWIALKGIQNNGPECKKYSLNFSEVRAIKPISLIELPGYGGHPAKEICDKLGIMDQNDAELLEKAKKEIYKAEHHTGKMKSSTPFPGQPVEQAKKKVKQDLIKQGKAALFYEMEGIAKCRCGTKVIAALNSEQWFVRYSDEKWKTESKETLKNMRTVPELYRSQYEYVFDWLEDKPCTRAKGLGTRFPWDTSQIIEPLGDSTIYMAYFTISHLVKNIQPGKLTPEVFDFVFLKKGNLKEVSKNSDIDEKLLEEMHKQFHYWYPLAFNVSAIELIPNHMSFSIFQHTAIFPPEKRQLGTLNLGMLIINGEKMASSKGNVVLIDDIADKIGVDMVRFFLMNFVEPWQEADWKTNEVESGIKTMNSFLEMLFEKSKRAKSAKSIDKAKLNPAEQWIINAFNERINSALNAYSRFELRKVAQTLSFSFISDMKWFERRDPADSEGKDAVYRRIIENWALLMAPIMPHICEELWELLGNKPFIVNSKMPEKMNFDPKIAGSEELIRNVLDDISKVKELAKIEKPKKIVLYCAEPWKWDALAAIVKECGERPDMGRAMKAVTALQSVKGKEKDASKFVSSVIKKVAQYSSIQKMDEYSILAEAKPFLEKEFSCPVEIQKSGSAVYDPAKKAGNSIPLKPAIYME